MGTTCAETLLSQHCSSNYAVPMIDTEDQIAGVCSHLTNFFFATIIFISPTSACFPYKIKEGCPAPYKTQFQNNSTTKVAAVHSLLVECAEIQSEPNSGSSRWAQIMDTSCINGSEMRWRVARFSLWLVGPLRV